MIKVLLAAALFLLSGCTYNVYEQPPVQLQPIVVDVTVDDGKTLTPEVITKIVNVTHLCKMPSFDKFINHQFPNKVDYQKRNDTVGYIQDLKKSVSVMETIKIDLLKEYNACQQKP
jgi:hypothetical protein